MGGALYRSLSSSDGVLLVGGGRSSLTTGLIALTLRIPLVSIASFGGVARQVWEVLDTEPNFATDEEIALMAQSGWRPNSAERLIRSLVDQGTRRVAEELEKQRTARRESRRTLTSLGIASSLLLLALCAIPLAWGQTPGTTRNLAILTAAPLLAATAGAIFRSAFDVGHDWAKTALLGFAAGAISFLLFVAAQLATTPDALEGTGARRLLIFVLAIGFIAGFTFDSVYGRVRAADVARISVIDQI